MSTVKELRARLKERGMDSKGNKAALLARLETAGEAQIAPPRKRAKGAPLIDPVRVSDSTAPFQFQVTSGSLAVGQLQCIWEAAQPEQLCFLRNSARRGTWTVWPCRVAPGTYLWMASHGENAQEALSRFQAASARGEVESEDPVADYGGYSVSFICRSSWGWWKTVEGFSLVHGALGSQRMFICDTEVAVQVAQWGQRLHEDEVGEGEDFLLGNYQLCPQAVHIKDPNQPEDYNLGWFVHDAPLRWTPASHSQFPKEFKAGILALLSCFLRLRLFFPAPIRQLIASHAVIEGVVEDRELVAFIWDPHYGGMTFSEVVEIGGIEGSLTSHQ